MPIRLSGGTEKAIMQIVLDRQSALDIGAFAVDGREISPGLAVPSDGDPRIDHALQGFFFTCGPDHIRHPEPIDGAEGHRVYPLHGSLCGTPVLRTAMTPAGEPPGHSAETEVGLADGGRARVVRRWAIRGDPPEVTLFDHVVNIGDTAFAPMLMYHINIGGWLCDDKTMISGAMLPAGQTGWQFGQGESAHLCLPAVAGAIDGWAAVRLGPFQAVDGRSLHVRFDTATLPYLQIWRCQRGTADVISIEPVSHRIAPRGDLAAAGELPLLSPGEAIDFALAFQMR